MQLLKYYALIGNNKFNAKLPPQSPSLPPPLSLHGPLPSQPPSPSLLSPSPSSPPSLPPSLSPPQPPVPS